MKRAGPATIFWFVFGALIIYLVLMAWTGRHHIEIPSQVTTCGLSCLP